MKPDYKILSEAVQETNQKKPSSKRAIIIGSLAGLTVGAPVVGGVVGQHMLEL
jgi:hypothetical protein